MSQKIKLTEVEHEIMQILWHLSEGSVNDVLKELPKERNLAYTSVSTILRILEQKKIVTARKEKRKHIYVPLIAKNDYQHTALDKLVENVFSGKSVELVNYLIDSSKLSVEEIKSIKKMLNDKLKEQ